MRILTVLLFTSLLAYGAEAVRFPQNPIIRPDMPTVGDDINGPSLALAPKWLEHPLGRYYLYFAGHRGTSIRLAYADHLAGPWKVHQPSVLALADTACKGHIASPDVHVDEGKREIRMYFHGPSKTAKGQKSFLAVSKDGVHFTASPTILGEAYFRVFRRDGAYYAISNGGILHRSTDGVGEFEEGQNLFPMPEGQRARHSAIKIDGDVLTIYYSRIGDNPESIMVSTLRMTGDWKQWKPSAGTVVLKPEKPWEGADLPLAPSKAGPAPGRVRQLRDPAIYREGGKTYLLYSVAGESGIAIAEVR
ncbi:MAG: hypothetical protein ABI823_11345 [Bryobacteraceae bacterium]